MLRYLFSAALVVACNLSHAANEMAPTFPTPPRISLLDGQVSFWRPGAQDWTPAALNTPLAAGDTLWTGSAGSAEVQIGVHAYARAGNATQLAISDVEPDYLQLRLTTGTASVDVRELRPGHAIEVDTPNAAFSIEHTGYYRVSVDEQSTSFITRRGGTAQVTLAGRGASPVNTSEEIVVSGTDAPSLQSYVAPELDDWDRWNYARTDYLFDSISARYVPAGVYGASDLDHSGSWRTLPDYGPVWFPAAVAPGWAPYSSGHWIYDPVFGWTWVDDAPWGYAPFHYGRWVYVGGYWGWAPGPYVAAPAYAPALVAWYRGVHVSAGAGVGWVALGWGEPVTPWWGPPGFVGRFYWGGWGGPRVVDNTVITNTTVLKNVSVSNISYVNAQYHDAVIATAADQFGHGRRDFVHPAAEAVHEWHPSALGAGVAPSAASLVPEHGRAEAPPIAAFDRSVVALHAPSDVAERLRKAGLPPPAQHAAAEILSPKAGPFAEGAHPTLQDLQERPRAPGAAEAAGTEAALRRALPEAPTPDHAQQHAGAPPAHAQAPWQAHAQPSPEREPGERTRPLERMRPPPPPGFNAWSKQEQTHAREARAGGGHVDAARPPASTWVGRAEHPADGAKGRLPGEPAMRLRPHHPPAKPRDEDAHRD